MGSALASIRGDRLIAMDANPDLGTLSERVRRETAATVRGLLTDLTEADNPRYADLRVFTSQSITSRLEVLASARDPAVSEAFTANDYRRVATLLEHFYTICITDCGTDLLHSATSAVLDLADQVFLVTIPSVAAARSANATLDWLEAHGHQQLLRSATVVLSSIRPTKTSGVDAVPVDWHRVPSPPPSGDCIAARPATRPQARGRPLPRSRVERRGLHRDSRACGVIGGA